MNTKLDERLVKVLTAISSKNDCQGSCGSCYIAGVAEALSFDERVEWLQEWGCSCGPLFPEGHYVCRLCPSIRNGDCDGPEVHCEDTNCPHKNERKCPVAWTECKFIMA